MGNRREAELNPSALHMARLAAGSGPRGEGASSAVAPFSVAVRGPCGQACSGATCLCGSPNFPRACVRATHRSSISS